MPATKSKTILIKQLTQQQNLKMPMGNTAFILVFMFVFDFFKMS